jgi:hypothetical protein
MVLYRLGEVLELHEASPANSLSVFRSLAAFASSVFVCLELIAANSEAIAGYIVVSHI